MQVSTLLAKKYMDTHLFLITFDHCIFDHADRICYAGNCTESNDTI